MVDIRSSYVVRWLSMCVVCLLAGYCSLFAGWCSCCVVYGVVWCCVPLFVVDSCCLLWLLYGVVDVVRRLLALDDRCWLLLAASYCLVYAMCWCWVYVVYFVQIVVWWLLRVV